MTTDTTIAETTVHRVITAWKGDEPGSAGFECLCGDTFDGFNTIAEAEACHKPLKADRATPVPQPVDPRAEYIEGLRALADLLEQNPHLKLPFNGSTSPMTVLVCNDDPQLQRKQLAAWARVLPGEKRKEAGEDYFKLYGNLRGLGIKVMARRDDVCERVVLGSETVTEVVPDPEWMAAAPMVEQKTVKEIVEWHCTSILAAATP